MRKLLLAASMLSGLATGAYASVIPVLDSVAPDGANFKFSYVGTLAGDQGLINGSRLIIYDFAGYVPGSISADGLPITVSTELVSSLVPPFGDNPTLMNLVFTWNGGPFQTTGGPFPDTDFNGLSAESTFSGVTLASFAAQTVTNNGAATGRPAFNFGEVGVPIAMVVPEPTSWALLLLGFGGLGAMLRTRRSLAQAV